VDMTNEVNTIRGGIVLRDGSLQSGDLHLDQGRIVPGVRGRPGGTVVDASGLIVAPGLIEAQTNGAYGHDFTDDPASLWQVGARLPEQGITAFVPTIISAPPDAVRRARAVVTAGPPPGYVGAVPIGLHCEGPMLAPGHRGTHRPAHLVAPSLDLIEGWDPAGGVAMVTIAPELPGAIAVIEELCRRSVVVAVGHSGATYEEALAAFAAGATAGTHLYNAMSGFRHREPGMVGALLAAPTVVAGIIADGIHSHPAAVAVAWKAKGPDHLMLVTDALAAAGMPHGRYRIGDISVDSGPSGARNESGGLAGSVLTLDEAVRNLVAFTGCSVPEALGAVTRVPARLLGLDDKGVIAPDAVADLVLLDGDLEVVATIVAGRLAYLRDQARAPARSGAPTATATTILTVPASADRPVPPTGSGEGRGHRTRRGRSVLWDEIFEQPETLRRIVDHNEETAHQVAEAWRREGCDQAVIAARGTSDNAARFAQYVWGARNRISVGLAAPSLFSVYQRPPSLGAALVVGISQSGQSPDIVAVLTEARRQHRPTVAITNDENAPLAAVADHVLLLHTGGEASVAATKTYTAQLAAVALLSAGLNPEPANDRSLHALPDLVGHMLDQADAVASLVERFAAADHCAVLGRGFNYATAFEWALKLQELAQVVAQPSSTADFLHGPVALVHPGFPILAIDAPGSSHPIVHTTLGELAERGADLMVIGSPEPIAGRTPATISLPDDIPEWITPIPAIVGAQLYTFHLAVARGLDPDRPQGLTKVTRTT
jgi:N-acetylglucosamine-6-phosphate deacetylase